MYHPKIFCIKTCGITVTQLDVTLLDQQLSEGPDGIILYDEDSPPSPDTESAQIKDATTGMRKSASSYVMSTNTNLDLVSCLHFLLDLFSHWLRNGCDSVPLPLLSATVESVCFSFSE